MTNPFDNENKFRKWIKENNILSDKSLNNYCNALKHTPKKLTGIYEGYKKSIFMYNDYISFVNIMNEIKKASNFEEENRKAGSGSFNAGMNLYKTFLELHNNKNIISTTKTNNYEHYTNHYINHYINLLLKNHNLILTGAPGTGKTYLAKKIAKEMGCSEDEIGFVQFHPSYDYTDFVEGLRPKKDENGNIGFERKNGVFKEFCRKAIEANKTNIVDNFDESWEKLIDFLENNGFIDVPLLSGKGNIRIELNEYGTGLANRTYLDNNVNSDWIKGRSKFFSKEQLYRIYKGLNGTPGGGHDNYRKAIVNHMKNHFDLLDYIEGKPIEISSQKPFVFIIDEINRGEISKIFGELFYCIDPGYRGEKGKIKTQYQNLVEDNDIFYEGFYIPENVYIIGTMNDIDRSVESMDFAFRRRFAFAEIKANENIDMLNVLNNNIRQTAINKMVSLNNAISKTEGLSPAYHIGASYFLKLNDYDGDFNLLWEYHLEGLLHEYVRGMHNVEKIVEKLKNSFFNEQAENN